MNVLRKVAGWFEFARPFSESGSKYRETLAELNSILFAVVFGIGLAQFDEVVCRSGIGLELLLLIVAYVAVLLSWWGYHYGITRGPAETNAICYLIDILLIGVYYFLINHRKPLWGVMRPSNFLSVNSFPGRLS